MLVKVSSGGVQKRYYVNVYPALTVSGSLGAAHGADLSVTLSDNPDPVVAGALLTYTVTVRNNGFELRAVSASPIRWTATFGSSREGKPGTLQRTKDGRQRALGDLGTANPQP